MKTTLFTLASLLWLSTTKAQETATFVMDYPKLETEADYKEAIIYYGQVITQIGANKDAYYKRATCQMTLNAYSEAINDFTKVIKLDPSYLHAYYLRAVSFSQLKNYTAATNDLTYLINQQPNYPKALLIRGLIKQINHDETGACLDFKLAEQNKDPQAAEYILNYCGKPPVEPMESLGVPWTKLDKWVVIDKYNDEKQLIVELVKAGETKEKCTLKWTSSVYKNKTNQPLNEVMNDFYKNLKQGEKLVFLNILEKDESGEYPWTLYSVESLRFKSETNFRASLWFIRQGKTNLFINAIELNETSIPDGLKKRWSAAFKDSEISFQ